MKAPRALSRLVSVRNLEIIFQNVNQIIYVTQHKIGFRPAIGMPKDDQKCRHTRYLTKNDTMCSPVTAIFCNFGLKFVMSY